MPIEHSDADKRYQAMLRDMLFPFRAESDFLLTNNRVDMGDIRSPSPVKLFIGMLSPEPALFDVCAQIICKECGPIDLESEIVPWDITEYYRDEMGDGIVRKFIFFERLMDPADLSKIKLITNGIEKDFAVLTGNIVRRRINLDPGYMTEAKVVLGTTKDYAHRIYIGSNIYAEVTLRYSNPDRSFVPLEYTYTDYRTDAYRMVFNEARNLLRAALHKSA